MVTQKDLLQPEALADALTAPQFVHLQVLDDDVDDAPQAAMKAKETSEWEKAQRAAEIAKVP